MAEAHSRAGRSKRVGRTRPARALTRAALLTGAILTVLLGGLFIARPAASAPAKPAAHAASATHAATQASAKLDALTQPSGGVCSASVTRYRPAWSAT